MRAEKKKKNRQIYKRIMCTLNLDTKGITTMNYNLFKKKKKKDEVTRKVVRDDPDENMGHRHRHRHRHRNFIFCRILYNMEHKPSRAFISTNKSKLTF